MLRMSPRSPDASPIRSGRRTRATGMLTAETERTTTSVATPERVGLYRRFTLGAAKRGWRLRPDEIEILLDIYVAYVRHSDEPSTDRCLRDLKRLRRRTG